MKKLTRIGSLVLAVILVFALASNAFASDRQYEIFQLFTGSVGEDGASFGNMVWGYSGSNKGTAITVGDSVPAAIQEELRALRGDTSKTEAEKAAIIAKYADLSKPLPTDKYTLTESDGSWTFSGLEPGYYLVRDKENTQNGQGDYYTLYCIQVVDGTFTVTPKGSIPTVDKVIVDDGTHTSNGASIGEEVNYQLTATVPSNINDYKEYYLQFVDTLSKGLTFNKDSVKVYFNSVSDDNEITQYFYVSDPADAENDAKTFTVTIGNLLALKNIAGKNYTFTGAVTKIIVTYSAVLNKDAVVVDGSNPNTVKLVYSNDPNNSGTGTTNPPDVPTDEPTKPDHTGETVEDKVETKTTKITIHKKDGTTKAALTGAEFTLTGDSVKVVLVTGTVFVKDENGTYYQLKDGTFTTEAPADDTDLAENYVDGSTYTKKVTTTVQGEDQDITNVTAEVDADGNLTFTGLGVGVYTLTETKTPAGYNTVDPITFEIKYNPSTGVFTNTNSNVTVNTDGTMELDVENLKGGTLPSTGGIGTTIFYVVGSVLVLCAIVLLITKRRMKNENN
jgi:fimbrial isopeptide formation D2 family protein/LPXTG-motif cell wall-anchored protein